jgi:hypothetical protein
MNKKYAVLFSTLLMAAALSGAAYAHWFKIITIDGTVETGRLHLYPDVTPWKLVQVEDKPVAYWGEVKADHEANSVYFELFNVYPCLTAELDVVITNDGTIPAGLKAFRFMGLVATPTFDTYTYDISVITGGYHVNVYNTDPDDSYMAGYDDPALMAQVDVTLSAEANAEWPTNSWYQVDPGCTVTAHIKVHFDEALPMSTTFKFGFELENWNWNEVELL